MTLRSWTTGVAIALMLAVGAAYAADKPVDGAPINGAQGGPVKIYILAGQSNMTETKRVDYLQKNHPELAADPKGCILQLMKSLYGIVP